MVGGLPEPKQNQDKCSRYLPAFGGLSNVDKVKYYSGIGSRQTPPDVLKQMQEFAFQAAKKGYVLRSGAAPGADSAFEQGCDDVQGKKEIFLPWRNFNHNPSTLYPPTQEAIDLSVNVHPAVQFLKHPVKLLIARNMHQILGSDLNTPVDFVICWTHDGCESHETYGKKTGGTGSAIALASQNHIPIFNIQNPSRYIYAVECLLQ